MSATTSPPSAQQVATALLSTLVQQLGAEVITAFVDIATGESEQIAIEDVSLLAMATIRGVLGVLEPAAVRALVTAGYAAADAQADVAENLKFPKE